MDHQLYIFTFFTTVFLNTELSDDDSFDRFNRKYTVYGLILLAILSSSHLLTDNVSSLISCWNRANFPSSYIDYTNYICFIANSYRLDPNESISNSIIDRLFKFQLVK